MNDETFPNALPPGTRIGPVVLERAIGQGAWGIVYEGRHDIFGRVAVKEYFPSTYASRQTRGSVSSSAPQWQDAVRRGLERFAQEGRALKSIRHENVVAVLDYIEEDGAALLVMDFVEGEPLSTALEAGQFRDPAKVTALGAALIETLVAIHAKNILHRDVAPDNIMIRADGSPVLIDFGGAAAAIASATRSTQNIVKDGYSPPEQYDTSANPAFPVGPWSDIYATAAVLYRLASGREPAVSNARLLAAGARKGADPLTPLSTLAPAGYSPEWLAAVDGALALVPKDRPQSAAEWRRRFEPAVKAPGRNWLMIGTTAASLAIAIGSAGVLAAPSIRQWFARPVQSAAPTPKPPPKATPLAHSKPKPRAQCDRAKDIALWDGVKSSTSAGDFQEYLRECGPKALFAGVARARMIDLSKVAQVTVAPTNPPPPPPTAPPHTAPPTRAPQAHPAVTRFVISPATVMRGATVRICYTAAHSDRVELRPTGLALGKTSDCILQSPLATTNYTLVAYAKSGATASGSARVTVEEPSPSPTPRVVVPTVAISKLTSTIAAGARGYVCYHAVNAQRVELQPDGLSMSVADGCFNAAPVQTTVYSVIAYSETGASASAPARIVVAAAATPTPVPTPGAINIAGTWIGQDNGVYQISQYGTIITWSAHAANNTWAHTFKGTLVGHIVSGYFADTPSSTTHNSGVLVLRVVDSADMVLVKSAVAGFPPSWRRQ